MTTALTKYADRWAVDDPVDDYVIMRHDLAMYALMREERTMKIRRVTIEVEFPYEYTSAQLAALIGDAFIEVWARDIPYQVQIISDVESLNTRIGDVLEYDSKAESRPVREFPIMPKY